MPTVDGMIRKLSIPLIAIMLCVGCVSKLSTPTPPVTAQLKETAQSSIDIQGLESQLGLVFVPANPSDIFQKILSKKDAIAKVQESEASVKGATSISAELGYLSDPILETMAARGEKVDPALLAHPLVWIISFEGLDIPSSGPPGSEHHIAHEYNVVINATTGASIMGFVYR
jgi:hypothetical protein